MYSGSIVCVTRGTAVFLIVRAGRRKVSVTWRRKLYCAVLSPYIRIVLYCIGVLIEPIQGTTRTFILLFRNMSIGWLFFCSMNTSIERITLKVYL